MLYLIYLLLTYFTIYFVGSFVILCYNLKEKVDTWELFFLKLLVGLISTTSVFALIVSNGETILAGLLLIFLIVYFNNKEKRIFFDYANFFSDYKKVFGFIPLFLIFSLVFSMIIYPVKEEIPDDFLFYGSIADYLKIYGIENTSMNIYHNQGVSIYHYFSEWTSAMLSKIFNITGSLAYIYIYIPLVTSILFIGVFALVKGIFKVSILTSIFYTILFFISSQFWGGGSVPSIFNINELHFRYGSYFFTANYIKLSIVISFFTAFLILFRRGKKFSAISFLLMLPIIWPTTLFGVFGGLILYFTYKFLKQRKIETKKIYLTLIVLFVFFSFYKIFGVHKIQYDSITTNSYLGVFLENFNYKEALIRFPKIIISRTFYFILFVVILIFNFKLFKSIYKRHKDRINEIFLIFLFLIAASMMGEMIFHYRLDSDQIFSNLVDNTILKYVSFFIVLFSLKSLVTKGVVFLFFLFTILTYIPFSDFSKIENSSEKYEIGNYVASHNKPTFAINLRATESVLPRVASNVYAPFNFLRTYTDSYFPTNISIFDRKEIYMSTTKDKIQFNSILVDSPYFIFINNLNLNHHNESNKIKFLKEKKIDFMIYEEGSLDKVFFNSLNIEKSFKIENMHILKLKWNE